MSEEGEDEDKKPSPIEARIAQVSRDIYSCSTEIIFLFWKTNAFQSQRWFSLNNK